MIGSSKPPLGRLERVELRDAWLGEATDFTPWLAQSENIALLGEAIGIELEVESQEKDVGPFRADILCRDTINNHFVLIENQHDPDPADTTYESTFIYLIRRRGRLWVETDRHRLGLFPLRVWRRLLRETGFRVAQVVGEPDRPGARGNATFLCVRPARKRNL